MYSQMTIARWLKVGLFNLMIVALYGMTMRYKIAFDFPYFSQRNLLHAHSHFAFNGWISHFLYTGLFSILKRTFPERKFQHYHLMIAANIFSAFAMLVSFSIEGYKAISITFSTLSILLAAIFTWQFTKDVYKLKNAHWKPWAISGLSMNVIAAAGPFYLAYMMISKTFHHEWYLASVYYFLHFQYNGWFFFASIAIAIHILPQLLYFKKLFLPFIITVVPTFILSVLWLPIQPWMYFVAVLATLVQLITWLTALQKIYKIAKGTPDKKWTSIINYAIVTALTLKFILQAVSVVPGLSQLVFGFRPIVIAYLHLVLLGVYSLFIIVYLLRKEYILLSNRSRNAVFFFLGGVILNELFLAIQGIGAFSYTTIPFINELLFGSAAVILLGAVCLFRLPFNPKA